MEESNLGCPPFLLSFQVFNYNVHKFLVDYSATTNVMPLSIAKKINAQWSETSTRIIQLDRTWLPAISELWDMNIWLSHDSWVHQCMNIVFLDIPEAYGLLLNIESSRKLDGYFATDWSHMWLLYKGNCNQIWVEYERYMKHNVTPINGENEPLALTELMFGNYLLETMFGCYLAWPAPIPSDTQLGLLPCPNDGNETCTTHCTNNSNGSSSTSTSSGSHINELWTLYFDKSKTHNGSRVGCVLIDPYNKKHLVSSCLEFECTNNVEEYEALMLGLQKTISLKVVMLKVISDSEIVVWKVHDTIHCLSPQLKNYQEWVWKLISNFQAFNIIVVPHTCNWKFTRKCSLKNVTD